MCKKNFSNSNFSGNAATKDLNTKKCASKKAQAASREMVKMKQTRINYLKDLNVDFSSLPKDSLLFNAELRVMPNRKTRIVRFYSVFLNKRMREKITYIIAKFDSKQRIFYLKPIKKSKTKLYAVTKETIEFKATDLTKELELKYGKVTKCWAVIEPTDFGFDISELIADKDAAKLYSELLKFGFSKHPLRATANNQCGDLTVMKNGKTYCVHISVAAPNYVNSKMRTTNRHRQFGKIVYQAMEAKENLDCQNIVILNKKLIENETFNKNTINFLQKQLDCLLFTDFSERWEEKIARRINADGVI